MKRKVALLAVALVGGAVAQVSIGAGQASVAMLRLRQTRVTVSPANGFPSTRFAVRFRAPQRTGRVDGVERRYQLSISGPSGSQACVASASEPLPFGRAHRRVHATLDPAKLGGKWCPGTFKGRIEEIESPVCARAVVCPEFVALLGTIGRFRFTVVRLVRAGVAPTFAGIKSAFACTPGAQRPGETTPFTLSWDAASDPVTPSGQIVYDVYESAAAGAENFAMPTWTTAAGVRSFRTPGLPSHGTFYFVVRARDQAGNEDRNRVELRGSDPCL